MPRKAEVFTSQQCHEVGVMTIPILQMRQPRHRKINNQPPGLSQNLDSCHCPRRRTKDFQHSAPSAGFCKTKNPMQL